MAKPGIYSPSVLWKELGKLIELPKGCRKFTLTCNHNEVPTVVAECVVRGSVEGGAVTKRYRLQEIRKPKSPVPQQSLSPEALAKGEALSPQP